MLAEGKTKPFANSTYYARSTPAGKRAISTRTATSRVKDFYLATTSQRFRCVPGSPATMVNSFRDRASLLYASLHQTTLSTTRALNGRWLASRHHQVGWTNG